MSQPLQPPPKGSMYLFDNITPPLPPDLYRVTTDTQVSFDAETHDMYDSRYFQVVGPRFALPPADVAGVFPPRNGRGPYDSSLAQIVIKRRTLPWERPLDRTNLIGDPADGNPLPAGYPVPWVALLLFEEGEYQLLENVPLEHIVRDDELDDEFQRLGGPTNVLCSAVEADSALVRSIMPSKEELQLLAHVRWVNTDDRELSVDGSNGWFAVVMTNRLPRPGKKCRACLVSLEERTDLISADPPPTFVPPPPGPANANQDIGDFRLARSTSTSGRMIDVVDPLQGQLVGQDPDKTRLVLLHSWQFTTEGEGTFFGFMQALDVGMMGKVNVPGKPALTDTAHMRLKLRDRGGTEEVAFYRGPLVPFELTRDLLGPYHRADQCRRAAAEAGAEDVSYAAAFEVGRLLAGADQRLAQELMRWRRESFRQSGRAEALLNLQDEFALDLPPTLAEKLGEALIPILNGSVIDRIGGGCPPPADIYGIRAVSRSIGFDPQEVKDAWGLASLEEAVAILGGDPGTLGVDTPPLTQTARGDTTLEQVAAEAGSMEPLNSARDRMLDNARTRMGG